MGKGKGKTGEQLALIDVAPKNAKPIIAVARRYKEAQAERIGALQEEIQLKSELIELIHKADLQRMKDGTIKFEYDGVQIQVIPRDDLVKVKDRVAEAESY